MLNTVQDRDFLYVPAAAAAFGAVRLDDQVPRYVPSFEGHTMKLEDLPHKEFAVPRPRLLQLDGPMLPPLDFRELKQAPAPIISTPVIARHLAMRLSKELAKRAVTQSVDLGGIVLSDPVGCRFQLGVSSVGKVDFALPLAATETAEVLQEIENRLRQMRFNPVTGQNGQNAGLTWGLVFFEIHQGGKE
ncbi:MAG: hypothetical protein ACOYMN_07195, partial [Roseimicrobium sp.]